jgi:pimeloyl-ACP methyl ester carboxylesterase
MSQDIIQFSHANGFPGSSYKTLFSLLDTQFEIHYIDMLGHNPDFPVVDNWTTLTDELISELDKKKHKQVIGIGHSFGGAVTLFAAIKRPDLFKMIILLDTPIFAFPKTKIIQLFKNIGRIDLITPGKRVKRRRTLWSSFQEVFDYYRSRPLFKHFTDECLHDYVTHGTIYTAEGVTLKFDPEIESKIYLTLPHNYSKFKHQLKIPGYALVGETSSVVKGIDKRSLKKNFNISCETLPGGHLFPFEYPTETARVITTTIERLTREK